MFHVEHKLFNMDNMFSQAPMPRIGGNSFNLSHEVKSSFRIGELVPTCVLDAIPGDVFTIQQEGMFRFAPLIAPVMHRVDVTTHYFFVPYRILWSRFEDFITGQGSPAPAAPYFNLTPSSFFEEGDVADYLGIPPGPTAIGQSIRVSPLIAAAYRKIYDEYYRDQNLQVAEVFVPLVDGDNTTTYGPGQVEGQPPLIRSLAHDYFTSALPFAQKGNPVLLPLTFQDDIPVDFSPIPGTSFPNWRNPVTGALSPSGDVESSLGESVVNTGASLPYTAYDPQGSLTVDVQSDAVTLDTLRTAIVIQEFLERDARGGTRYVEKIKNHFGVVSSDARLQRPEYIGGAKQTMAISEVLSTSQSDNNPSEATQFVGQMAGHGISVGGGNSFKYRVEEFGCIIGITSAIPETTYQQGLHKMFQKFNPLDDFAWPAFANLGEQPVENQEIYMASADPAGTFGYQSRYAEYKSIPSRVSGEFRSTLSFWHMGVIFDSEPALNDSFIQADAEKFDRIFAVTDPNVDHIYSRIVNNVYAYRKLPRFGIPSFGSVSSGQ